MSDSPVTFREKLVKFGTWLFLVFLFAIIVVSFGMPDFMGSSSKMEAYNAAKIGSEYLTKAEVSEYQKNIEARMTQNMKGLDEKTRKMVEDMAKGRALDEAIDRKIFTQILESAGYVPKSSSETKILAAYYKRAFAEFIVNGKLDTEKLNEFLEQRRLTLDQIGRNMLQGYGPQKAHEMLQATSYASDFAIIDDARFAATQNSFRIVAIDSGSREKILRAGFNPSDNEIQEKFKAEFLSKDPKSVLDQAKRDTIRATLFNERRATLEKDFTQKLTQALKTGIDSVATAAGSKVITINDAGLATDLDSKKDKEFAAVTLSPLSQSDIFVKQRLSAPIGQAVGPVDAGGFTYFFVVTGRKNNALPNAAAYAKLENGAAEFAKVTDLPKDVSFEKIFDTQGKTNFGQILTAALETQRHSVRIIRYGKTKGSPEAP